MILRWLAVLAIFFQGFQSPIFHAQTTEGVSFENSHPAIEYGKRVTFKVRITATKPVSMAFVYVEPQGRPAAFYPMTLSSRSRAVIGSHD